MPDYNPSFDTPLGAVDETLYRLWKRQYAPTDPGKDYDYRGAYAAGQMPMPPSGHWTDQFKKPNHPTFSVESQYAGAYPEKAGRWEDDKYIPAGYQEGTSNVMNNPREEGLSHFEMGRQWAKALSNALRQNPRLSSEDTVGRGLYDPIDAARTGQQAPADMLGPDLSNTYPIMAEQGTEDVRGTSSINNPLNFQNSGRPNQPVGLFPEADTILFRLWKAGYDRGDRGIHSDYRGAYAAGETTSLPPNWEEKRQVPAGYAQGTDSVPAMLSPREAVMNRNAAELLGRQRIAQLNAQGNRLAEQGIDLAGRSNPRHYQTGTSNVIDDPNDPRLRDTPLNDPASETLATPPQLLARPSNPFAFRAQYQDELKDPAVRAKIYQITHREVGSGDAAKTTGFLEQLVNRANARGQTLAQAASDRSYYDKRSFRPATIGPQDAARYDKYLQTVMGGSNVSNYATGNASGDVGFNKGPTTAYFSGGERGGLEGPDIPWFQKLTGLREPPPAINVSATPAPTGGTSPSYNAGAATYAAEQAAQAGAEAKVEKENPWATAGKQLGEDIQKQAAAQEAAAQARMSTAISNVPTSNPLLASLAGDPTSPYRNALAMSQYPTNEFQPLFGGG